jgi:hypothetical protein
VVQKTIPFIWTLTTSPNTLYVNIIIGQSPHMARALTAKWS